MDSWKDELVFNRMVSFGYVGIRESVKISRFDSDHNLQFHIKSNKAKLKQGTQTILHS